MQYFFPAKDGEDPIHNKSQNLPIFAFFLTILKLAAMQIRIRNMDYLWRYGLMPFCLFFVKTQFNLRILRLQLGRIIGEATSHLPYHWVGYEHFGFFRVTHEKSSPALSRSNAMMKIH